MPYSGTGRLPGEAASKLGHLAVIQSEWVKSLVEEFESGKPSSYEPEVNWTPFDPAGVEPLPHVWAVDGSFVPIATQEKPPREVSFVKTALLTLDRVKLDRLDREHPHPLLLRDVLSGSAVFHATVFPLKNVRTAMGSNYDAVRHIVRDSIKLDENGAFYDTLKWLAYRKWGTPIRSPAFQCPHCDHDIASGLPADADEGRCGACNGNVFLSDMIGFHLEMDEDSAPESISSSYMLVMEHLMLLTAVRLLWDHTDKQLVSNTLFIKDGPLTLRSQYSKLVPNLRAFLEHAKEVGRPVHVIGQEKSGAFFDHLASISRLSPPTVAGEPMHFSALTHDYVRREVYRSPDLSNPYGSRTNWGEKLLVKMDPACSMVLNVPTGGYDPTGSFPSQQDLIGLPRILATLPSLVSRKFEGALFPIELANGIASMSSYPSARVLQRFIEG